MTVASCDAPSIAFEDVVVRENLSYAPDDGPWPRRFDLALPPGDGPHPLLVLFHAGGWANGDEDQLGPAIRRAAQRGYATASVSYRLANAPDARRFPDAVADARCAVRHLRREAEALHLDTTRVVAGGFSAGGHLAAMLLLADDPQLDGDCEDTETSPRVAAAFAYYAPLDLRQDAPVGDRCHEIIDNFLGEEDDAATRRLASPVAHVTAGRPMLLVHGTADRVVDIDSSRAMLQALRRAGSRATLVEVDGADHGMPFLDLDDANPRVRCTTEAFLREAFGLQAP